MDNTTVSIVGAIDDYKFSYGNVNRILGLLQKYYLPFLMVAGSLGNFLSMFVLLTTKMRRSSSSLYLAALAFSDTGFLARTFINWLQHLDIQIANQQVFCQMVSYFAFVFGFLSSW
ncbi:hypothetical protein QAD02_011326 [Eretmocerus hayati]|uniref:Uncharacterized protein n=1 Tax=Eretmocerus hayati TaxID=131215 RepID=A0ACC2P167_9HYME|nr:hypothetical protein QAD02_011326 [Eretmocerus hayati]